MPQNHQEPFRAVCAIYGFLIILHLYILDCWAETGYCFSLQLSWHVSWQTSCLFPVLSFQFETSLDNVGWVTEVASCHDATGLPLHSLPPPLLIQSPGNSASIAYTTGIFSSSLLSSSLQKPVRCWAGWRCSSATCRCENVCCSRHLARLIACCRSSVLISPKYSLLRFKRGPLSSVIHHRLNKVILMSQQCS